ncbi:MAG: hypothetical protein NTW25_15715 [Candidatus Kapabacteria bacterium]|nr:hypothetical protein [Candidatus Kapabacteria bacterium]
MNDNIKKYLEEYVENNSENIFNKYFNEIHNQEILNIKNSIDSKTVNLDDYHLIMNSLSPFTKNEQKSFSNQLNVISFINHFKKFNFQEKETSKVDIINIRNHSLIKIIDMIFDLIKKNYTNEIISTQEYRNYKYSDIINDIQNLSEKDQFKNLLNVKSSFKTFKGLANMTFMFSNIDLISEICLYYLFTILLIEFFPVDSSIIKLSDNFNFEYFIQNKCDNLELLFDKGLSNNEMNSKNVLKRPDDITIYWNGTDNEFVEVIYLLMESGKLEFNIEDTVKNNKGKNYFYLKIAEIFNVSLKRSYSSIIDNIKGRKTLAKSEFKNNKLEHNFIDIHNMIMNVKSKNT